MSKQPYFPFYPGDWLKDSDVRRCSIFARGLLVDLLCLCHESKHRGKLCEADGVSPWSDHDIVAAVSGGTREQLLDALSELERKGVLSRDLNGCLYSRRMVRDEQIRAERAAAGSAGGLAKSKQSSSKSVANGLANSKQIPEYEYEYETEDKTQEKGVAAKKFSPPTVAEVRGYCAERGNSVDAEHFVDFYASKGWKVGNQSMKDWKACVRTWEKTAEQSTVTKSRGDPRGNHAVALAFLEEAEKQSG